MPASSGLSPGASAVRVGRGPWGEPKASAPAGQVQNTPHLMGCPRSYDFLRVRGDVSEPRDCRGLEQKVSEARPPSHARAPRSPLRPAWHPPYKVLPLVGRLMVRETLSR